MKTRSSIDLSQFPDSAVADELRKGVSWLRFAPALEAVFRRHHLTLARVRTRTWGIVTALAALSFLMQQLSREGPLDPGTLMNYVLVSAALVVGWLTWSRHYLKYYLPIAGIATPIASALTAPFSAFAAAEGHYEVLPMFALQIVAMFQFTGLLFRTALVTCIAMVAGFAVGAVMSLPPDAATTYIVTMSMATFIGAIAFHDAEAVSRTQFLEDKLIGELLERDPLTGLKNRRSFDEHLLRIWLQAQRDNRLVAILMIDADDFKRYNDTYGHQAGDEALRRIGGVLNEFGRRPLDLAARYGGEEFALVMSDVTAEHASKVADHLRTAVAGLGIAHAGSRAAPTVTLSVGVAVGKPVLGRTVQGLVRLADEALYEAKAAGRNRVVVKGPEVFAATNTGVFSAPEERKPDRAAS